MLTFCLLEAVIETPLQLAEDMLVKSDHSDKLVMTTSCPIDIIRSWLSRIEQTQEQLLEPWFERARANLLLAHFLIVSLTTMNFRPFELLGDAIPSMVCFIAIIAETLFNAHTRMALGHHMTTGGFSWSGHHQLENHCKEKCMRLDGVFTPLNT